MSGAKDFAWTKTYMALADKLADYRYNRRELIEKIAEAFAAVGMKMPVLEKDSYPEDMDPFTVFGVFSKNLKSANRQLLLKFFANVFGIDTEVPDRFTGLPILNTFGAAFYALKGERGEKDIDNLWETFVASLELAKDASPPNRAKFSAAFDQAQTQKKVKWNLTIGLFWVRPWFFMNLDEPGRRFFMKHLAKSPEFANDDVNLKAAPSGEKYLALCDKCRQAFARGSSGLPSFPEISAKSWKDVPSAPKKGRWNSAGTSDADDLEKPAAEREEGEKENDSRTEIYDKAAFLADTFLESEDYDALADILEHKYNLILQG
ncbi:MAG: hypothetical protein K2H64_04335, partial [Desulfovibrio sp.]|nr:hypothetical protein [Desulfovibrio sp.]